MAVETTPVSVFLAVTSTPGINAPVESFTVPLRVALTPAWANPDTQEKRISTTTTEIRSHVISFPPLFRAWLLCFQRECSWDRKAVQSEQTDRKRRHSNCRNVARPH